MYFWVCQAHALVPMRRSRGQLVWIGSPFYSVGPTLSGLGKSSTKEVTYSATNQTFWEDFLLTGLTSRSKAEPSMAFWSISLPSPLNQLMAHVRLLPPLCMPGNIHGVFALGQASFHTLHSHPLYFHSNSMQKALNLLCIWQLRKLRQR